MHRTRTIIALLAAALVLPLAGCGGNGEGEAGEESATPAQAAAEIATIKGLLDRALAEYRRGAVKAADRTVGDAYLDHFEEVEDPLGDRDHELMEGLEHTIATELRDRMKARAPTGEVATLVAATKRDLDEAAATLRE
jgi:hypothetical protein